MSYDEILKILDNPAIRMAQEQANIAAQIIPSSMIEFAEITNRMANLYNNDGMIAALEAARRTYEIANYPLQNMQEIFKTYQNAIASITRTTDLYNLLSIYPSDLSEEEIAETKKTDDKIVSEIFIPNDEKIITEQSPIITISPVNDQVLKYLSEHPEELYRVTPNEFENVMAEIYAKLGYKVERTQATRDGGKDIIIRKPEILGDFVYYVECKKYAANRPVGVGIIRNLQSTINTDRVNGGILATTSYFTRDAREFINLNNYHYQIQMHDYDKIRDMLKIASL